MRPLAGIVWLLVALQLSGCPSPGDLSIDIQPAEPCPGDTVKFVANGVSTRPGTSPRAFYRVSYPNLPPAIVYTELKPPGWYQPFAGGFIVPEDVQTDGQSAVLEIVFSDGPYATRASRNISLCGATPNINVANPPSPSVSAP